MASSANPFSLFLLITLLTTLLYTTTHARENQFFNKASTTNTNNNNLVPDDVDKQPLNNQPDFLPEKDNGYGLSGHNSVQLPPSATTTESKQPLPKYLPRNYNPVAYVTEPEDTNTFAEEKSYYNNGGGGGGGERNYYYSNNNNNNQQQEEEEEEEPPYRRSYPNTRSNYYNGGGGGGSSFNSGGEFRRPQGMSDTRSLENGKYYYDLNTEKYNSNHPYERLKARNEYSNVNRNNYRGYESNGRDNSVRGYRQNGREEDQYFQDEGYNNNLP
ncbi:hypothetical protein ABFS83_08G138200 [Erythranthe nasuta]